MDTWESIANSKPPERSSSKWKMYYKKWILIWSPLSHIWLFVLLVSVFNNEDASSLSIISFVIFICSSIIWFIYGFFVLEDRNYAIIASAVTAFCLGCTSILAIILYGDPEKVITREMHHFQKDRKKKNELDKSGVIPLSI